MVKTIALKNFIIECYKYSFINEWLVLFLQMKENTFIFLPVSISFFQLYNTYSLLRQMLYKLYIFS